MFAAAVAAQGRNLQHTRPAVCTARNMFYIHSHKINTHTHTLTHSSVVRGTYTNQETNIIHPLWAELRQVPALNLAVMSGSLISSAAADGGRRGSECVFIKGAEEQADRVSHKSPLLCWGSKREEVNVEV